MATATGTLLVATDAVQVTASASVIGTIATGTQPGAVAFKQYDGTEWLPCPVVIGGFPVTSAFLTPGTTTTFTGPTLGTLFQVVTTTGFNGSAATVDLLSGGSSGGGGAVTVAQLPAALGQTTMAASLPVVVASDQAAFSVAPVRGALTDRGGTIAVDSTSQQVAAANASRSYLMIINTSTHRLWVNFGAAAVANTSFPLEPAGSTGAQGGGISLEGAFISTDAVNIIGGVGSIGSTFFAKEG